MLVIQHFSLSHGTISVVYGQAVVDGGEETRNHFFIGQVFRSTGAPPIPRLLVITC